MYKGFVLLILTLFITTLHAQTIDCRTSEENYFRFDTTRVTIHKNKYHSCSFSISPLKLYDQYRNYSLNTEGHFFIFNVFDLNGSVYESTGARSFYIAPVLTDNISLTYRPEEHTITITTPSGAEVTFDTIHTQLVAIPNIDWKEDTRIDKENEGGVDLLAPLSSQYYIYDFGWRQGSDPRALLTRNAKLISNSQVCTPQTKQLLAPIYDRNGDVDSFELRYTSTQSIEDFWSNYCL